MSCESATSACAWTVRIAWTAFRHGMFVPNAGPHSTSNKSRRIGATGHDTPVFRSTPLYLPTGRTSRPLEVAEAEKSRPAPVEHPVMTEARRRGWDGELEANAAEWREIIRKIEAGDLPANALKTSRAKTGAEFRTSMKAEAQANGG